MLKIPKVYASYHIYLIHSKYAICDFREVTMLNAEKIKKRFYIFLVFYFLFGTTIYFLFDSAVSPDFTRQYKIILFVLEVVYFDLPLVLALIINNYIAKRTKTVEK